MSFVQKILFSFFVFFIISMEDKGLGMPAIYFQDKNVIMGGTEIIRARNVTQVQEKFLEIFEKYGKSHLPLINVRNVFKTNLVDETVRDAGLNRVFENYKQKMAITVDVSEEAVKIDMPVYLPLNGEE